jgi:hypothetical protein
VFVHGCWVAPGSSLHDKIEGANSHCAMVAHTSSTEMFISHLLVRYSAFTCLHVPYSTVTLITVLLAVHLGPVKRTLELHVLAVVQGFLP